MYMTHTFAHRETLSRAHSWLTQLGFHPRQAAPTSGVPRLVIVDDAHRLAAAKMLINAAENADPDGFTSFWGQKPLTDLSRMVESPAVGANSVGYR
jgi:hypothetical protein